MQMLFDLVLKTIFPLRTMGYLVSVAIPQWSNFLKVVVYSVWMFFVFKKLLVIMVFVIFFIDMLNFEITPIW